jgi:hypothetical protein
MRAQRRDANEADLISLARMLGAHCVKSPPLDYWVCHRNAWHVVEIKRPEREGRKTEYTDAQARFFTQCRMYGSPWNVWRTQEDVLEFIRGKQ